MANQCVNHKSADLLTVKEAQADLPRKIIKKVPYEITEIHEHAKEYDPSFESSQYNTLLV